LRNERPCGRGASNCLEEISASHRQPEAQDYADTQITSGICGPRNGVQRSNCTAAILNRLCPLWVRSGHRRAFRQCPLYPQKRTLLERGGMSALSQKRTSALKSTMTSDEPST
jgi:hypothetical protein